MHKLSIASLAALLLVGGVLAFVIFVSPDIGTAAAPQPAQSQPPASQTAPPANGATNSTLLTQPPAPTGGTDDGSGFDS